MKYCVRRVAEFLPKESQPKMNEKEMYDDMEGAEDTEILKQIISPDYPEDPWDVLGMRYFEPARMVPKAEKGTAVQEFYRDATVFVTGGTGFLGLVLIEKLLRSCPHINRVYILVRTKKDKSPQQRFDDIVKNPLFKRLEHENPLYREKMTLISGALDEPHLGLSNEDRQKLTNEVTIVFHCAATVRFNEALGTSVKINLLGTREMLELARDMKNLKVFMYVSTTYLNFSSLKLDEKVYPMDIHYEDVIRIIEQNDQRAIEELEQRVLREYPNTYAFTKKLTENMIVETSKDILSAIFRPSVVMPTYREPIRGWTNTLNGPLSLIVAFATGVLHVFHGHATFRVPDPVPVDFVVNGLICAARETSLASKNLHNQPHTVPVFNFANAGRNTITWKYMSETYYELFCEAWSLNAAWYPCVIFIEYYPLFRVLSYLLHEVFGRLFDTIRVLTNSPLSLTRLYIKMDQAVNMLEYFARGTWLFRWHRMEQVWKNLGDEDRDLFLFDVKQIDWVQYISRFSLGMRLYLLKDDLHTLPKTRKKMKKLRYLHYATKTLFYALILFIIYKCINFVFG